VSLDTAVTLTGRFAGSCGSFCAVTVIGGNDVVSGGCALAPAGTKHAKPAKAAKMSCRGFDLMFGIREFSHIFWCSYDA
jgi:hypothetical protein